MNKKLKTEQKLIDKYHQDIEDLYRQIGTGKLDRHAALTKLNQFETSFVELQGFLGSTDFNFPGYVTGEIIERSFKILEEIIPIIRIDKSDMEAVKDQQFHLKCITTYQKFINNPDFLQFYNQEEANFKKL